MSLCSIDDCCKTDSGHLITNLCEEHYEEYVRSARTASSIFTEKKNEEIRGQKERKVLLCSITGCTEANHGATGGHLCLKHFDEFMTTDIRTSDSFGFIKYKNEEIALQKEQQEVKRQEDERTFFPCSVASCKGLRHKKEKLCGECFEEYKASDPRMNLITFLASKNTKDEILSPVPVMININGIVPNTTDMSNAFASAIGKQESNKDGMVTFKISLPNSAHALFTPTREQLTMTPHTKDDCPRCEDQIRGGRKTCFSHKEDDSCRVLGCARETNSKFGDYCQHHNNLYNKSDCNYWDEFCQDLLTKEGCEECKEHQDMCCVKTCIAHIGDECDVYYCHNKTNEEESLCATCLDVYFKDTICDSYYDFTTAVFSGEIEALKHLSYHCQDITIKGPKEAFMDKALQVLTDDSKEAAKRLAGKQFVKLVRDPLAAAIARGIDPNDEALRAKLSAFLRSDLGEVFMGGFLSLGLEMAPSIGNGVNREIARELRVEAMANGGDQLLDVVMGPLRSVISSFVQGEVPAALDAVNQTLTKVDVAVAEVVEEKVNR